MYDPYNRVWQHSRQRGLRKLLMLAFAKHADALGVCWPSVETLAELTGEDNISYLRSVIAELISDGELIKNPGKGRGNSTVYGVIVGLDEAQAERLRDVVSRTTVKKGVRLTREKSAPEWTVSEPEEAQNSPLQNSAPELSVSENSAPEWTVSEPEEAQKSPLEKSPLEKSLLQPQKRVHYSFAAEGPNPAAEPAKTTQNDEDNYHGTHGGGDVGATEKMAAQVSSPARKPGHSNGPPPHVLYLSAAGMGAAHLFADCDPDAAIADFDARIADRWPIRAIVTQWKLTPPKPGAIYEQRHPDQDQPERSSRDTHGRPGRPASRAARPGERDYYK